MKRYIWILVFLLNSCLKPDDMVISKSCPIEFYDVVDEVCYNSSDIYGVEMSCFCQKQFKSKLLYIQAQSTVTAPTLTVNSSDGTELESVTMTNKTGNFYEHTLDPLSYAVNKINITLEIVMAEEDEITVKSGSDDISSTFWLNDEIGYACINTADLLYKTVDGGLAWSDITGDYSDPSAPLNVWFFDEQVGIMTGDVGNIHKTNNGGVNWTKLPISGAGTTNKIIVVNNVIYISDTAGEVFKSISRAANTWTNTSLGETLNIMDLSAVDENNVLAVMRGDRVQFTNNGGTTWTQYDIPAVGTFQANSGFMLNASTWYVCGEQNSAGLYSRDVWRTTDSGTTWTRVHSQNAASPVSFEGIRYVRGYIIAVSETGGNIAYINIDEGGSWINDTITVTKTTNTVTISDKYFVISLDDGIIKRILISDLKSSECVDLLDTITGLIEINYYNNSDFDNISYENTLFTAYIPAQFWKETSEEEFEDDEKSDGNFVRVFNQKAEKKLLEIGYVPNYMHEKIRRILMHDNIEIDGKEWVKRDEYEHENINRYGLSKARVWLTKKDGILKNVI